VGGLRRLQPGPGTVEIQPAGDGPQGGTDTVAPGGHLRRRRLGGLFGGGEFSDAGGEFGEPAGPGSRPHRRADILDPGFGVGAAGDAELPAPVDADPAGRRRRPEADAGQQVRHRARVDGRGAGNGVATAGWYGGDHDVGEARPAGWAGGAQQDIPGVRVVDRAIGGHPAVEQAAGLQRCFHTRAGAIIQLVVEVDEQVQRGTGGRVARRSRIR
jgi:hypothetical protein